MDSRGRLSLQVVNFLTRRHPLLASFVFRFIKNSMLSLLFLGDKIDYKDRSNGKNDADGEADPGVGHKSCDDEHQKGDSRYGDRVGKLGGNVINVVALRTCRSHYGGVGNGGAMVTADSACKACRNSDKL